MQDETTWACAIWRCFRVMDRCVVLFAASVQTLPPVCRACLRILICESERALGADRSAQRFHPIRSRTIALSRSQRASERCLDGDGDGDGERASAAPSNGHRTTEGPLGHVLPYQSRKCSQARFSAGRPSPCAFISISTLVVTCVAQHSSQPRCSAFHHRLQPHPTNGPDQDTRNTTQIARHGT